MLWWYVFYRNNRKWIDIDKLAALFVQVTVGRRNVPKGRVWNPMEQSKWTEVSSTVNYTQILFHVGQGSPAKCPAMVGRGSPAGGKLHSNFVGLKFIINCFSLAHIIWWVFIWLAITVFGRHHGCTDQNVAGNREVKWWQKAMYKKLLCCIYERLFLWTLYYF